MLGRRIKQRGANRDVGTFTEREGRFPAVRLGDPTIVFAPSSPSRDDVHCTLGRGGVIDNKHGYGVPYHAESTLSSAQVLNTGTPPMDLGG